LVDPCAAVAYRAVMRFSPSLALFPLIFLYHPTVQGQTLEVAGDLGYACFAQSQRHHGAFGGMSAKVLFSDLFGVDARYNLSEHRSKGDSQSVHRMSLGAVANLDVFEYIPWASLSATVLAAHGDHLVDPLNYGIGFGLGFDRLIDPSWSVGFAAQFDQIFGQERFPAYMLMGIRVGYRWRLGAEFAP